MSIGHLEKRIILKKKEDRRILAGHPWVYSNEIRDTFGSPLIGDVVELFSASGISLGVGFYNPHSLIAFRLLSRKVEEIDAEFFLSRISKALALRQRMLRGQNTYRLVHGEGDFLPGLIIDRFEEYCSLQTFSYGMDSRKSIICDVLESLLQPKGIIERNESSLRVLEGLEQRKGVLRGESGAPVFHDREIRFEIDLLNGQKTGFFLDQRENRLRTRAYSHGKVVLDCFCNDGGFALHCAVGGAKNVTGIDASEDAIMRARKNADLSNLSDVRFEQGDVFEKLAKLAECGDTFDMIILDPPSFTKSRKNVPAAKKGYKELNSLAIRLLSNDGVLFSASCSHHITPEVFLQIVETAANELNRDIQLLEWREAAPDHPIIPAVPETRYLKLCVIRVTTR